MKRILVISYSQSGQLYDIVDSILSGVDADGATVDHYRIEPEPDFPFPWTRETFFDAFPESFQQVPRHIKQPGEAILEQDYDLVILGYQVWYLSPSIPFNSFLQSEWASRLLKDRPIITVIGCRNMWVMAQEKVKKQLHGMQARLVGNIVLTDRHPNHISVITIVHWMFCGKKTRYLGIFPKPGVSEKDICSARDFGKPIQQALMSGNFEGLQPEIVGIGGVRIKPFLVLADKRANLIFSKWARYVSRRGPSGSPRRRWALRLFNGYLFIAIWVFAPIVFVVFLLTYLPRYTQIKRERAYYSSVAIEKQT